MTTIALLTSTDGFGPAPRRIATSAEDFSVTSDRGSRRPRLGQRIDQVSRFELRRIEDDGRARLAELLEVVGPDVLVLDEEDARLLPFPQRSELHVADDRLECGGVQVVGNPALIDAADGIHRLREDLHLRIGEW